MSVIRTYERQADVNVITPEGEDAGGFLDMEIDYVLNPPIPGNKTDPYEPESIDIQGIRWKINNKYIGVKELRPTFNQFKYLENEILDARPWE